MTVAVCPRCEAEYLGSVTMCGDCGIPLVDPEAEAPAELEGDLVGYDLDDWTPEQRAELTGVLVREQVASRWEGAELLVAEADSEVAEELIDEIDNPDALASEEDGDDDAAEVLSALYVASDVLVGDPRSSVAVVEVLEAAEEATAIGMPYGLDGDVWSEVLRSADALADLLGADSQDDDVVAAARRLREAVRPLV